jgi:hypothetical protein
MVPEVKVDLSELALLAEHLVAQCDDGSVDEQEGWCNCIDFLRVLAPILEAAAGAIASLPQIATAHAEQAVIQAQGQIAQVARTEARAYRSGDRGPCTAQTALENFAASLERSADKMAGKEPAPAPKKGLILQ